jgi:DNA-binding CsgD family transcriptional regulator
MHRDELDSVRAIVEDIDSQAAERGDESSRVHDGWILGILEWLAGRWQLALEHTTSRWELAEQIQTPHSRAWVGRAKALVEIDLVEQARATIAETFGDNDDLARVYGYGLLGRLELALGNLDEAGELLRDVPSQLLAWGLRDPTLTSWADATETLVGLGELDRARSCVESYETNAARLGSAWAIAAAARGRGLLASADGDPEGALAAFERALAELDRVAFPFERGRTLLCLGSTLRRGQQKSAAREALERSRAIFEGLGAPLWAEKTNAELRRISGRPPEQQGLSESEQRVVALAVRGHTNKEIAATLYMGVRTVEAHLTRVYRKLGVRSRSALTARVTADSAAKEAVEQAEA